MIIFCNSVVDCGTAAYVDGTDGLDEQLVVRQEDCGGKKEAGGCWIVDHHGYCVLRQRS